MNIFGLDNGTLGRTGKRGPQGPAGPRGADGATGPRGAPGEAAGYLAEWFQHRADLWDVDLRPNFWVDGFDVELDADGVLKKVLNQAAAGAKYDAVAPAGHVPTIGTTAETSLKR